MSVNITDTTNTINDGFQVVKSKKSSKKKRVTAQSFESKDHTTDSTKSQQEIEKCDKHKLFTSSGISKKSTDTQRKPNGEIYYKDERYFSHGESTHSGSSHKSSGCAKTYSEQTDTGKLLPNKKRVLCYSYVTQGECPYGIKCVYAHTIKEQNIDPLRKKVYDILNSNTPLNDIDFVHDIELYKTFLQLTRTCYGCENNMCVGGYNCKKGAIDLEHTICYDDMYNGECQYGDTCDKIHLTKRRLVPKTIQLLIMTGYSESDKNSYVKKLMNVTRSVTGPLRPSVVEQHDKLSESDTTMSISSRRMCEMIFMANTEKSGEYIKTFNKCVDDDVLSVESYESLESQSSDDCDKYILMLQPI